VAGVEQQGGPGGQRVEPGIVVRNPRWARRAQQRGVEDRLALGQAISPDRPRRANRAACPG
jgi:hypothetical protein